MGPASANALPNRPRYSWDIRNAPWTDGVGDQENYANAVSRWCAFHDSLPDTNSNKVLRGSRGLILQSQLYGRAKVKGDALSDDLLKCAKGVDAVIDAVYKMDALSVCNAAYSDYVKLLSVRRSVNESYANYEDRFSSAVTKLNTNGSAVAIPDILAAWSLIHNANIDPSQHLGVMSAAANSSQDGDLTRKSGKNAFLESIKYESVAAVVRQCDHNMSSTSNRSISSMSANTGNRASRCTRSNRKKRLTPHELADLKKKSRCHLCKKFGHWATEHNEDGSLPPTVRSTDEPVDCKVAPGNGSAKETVTFNMARVTTKDRIVASSSKLSCDVSVGPLLDDGAPYSALGADELSALAPQLVPGWNGGLDPIPDALHGCTSWQYGTGEHSSPARDNLGSIELHAVSVGSTILRSRHLVLRGSSQWVVGRNVTNKCEILHADGNRLRFKLKCGTCDYLALKNFQMHSYVPRESFRPAPRSSFTSVLSALHGVSIDECSWQTIKKTVDKVHKHVCGHAPYSDIKLLLVRNSFWNEHVQRYLTDVIENCTACRKTALPKGTRKVSLSSMSRSFNQVVCVDHFYLNGLCLFHAMDSVTRYSGCSIVPDTSLEAAVVAYESCWLCQFWPPSTVLGDAAFKRDVFINFLRMNDTEFCPIPPRRHNKNVLESKHGVIRGIFLRLLNEDQSNAELAAVQAVPISNDLYGSDILSSFEMAKGFTKPVVSDAQARPLHPDLMNAQLQLEAKRKFTRILRSKAIDNTPVAIGDLIEVFVRHGKNKKGKWLSPRCVLSIDPRSGSLTVPGSSGRTITAAFEDVRAAMNTDSFATIVQESIDTLEREISDALDQIATDSSADECVSSRDHDEVAAQTDGEVAAQMDSIDDTADNTPVSPSIGDRIDVFWPLDNAFYPGVVTDIDNGHHQIQYDDGDKETLEISNETWRFSDHDYSVQNAVACAVELFSSEQSDLKPMFEHFGNKPFLAYQAQGFPSYMLHNAYHEEEESFKRTVRVVARSTVPSNANVISSHVIYKIKVNDDESLKLKARIAPHGNEDSLKHEMRADCSMCAPMGIRLLISIATIYKWRLTKVDVKSAFLQTGAAERQVFVIPPRESSDRFRSSWL